MTNALSSPLPKPASRVAAISLVALFCVGLSACGDAGQAGTVAAGALLETGAAVARDAAGAAAELADTKSVCVIAGQSPAFCGCLQNELGPRVDTVAVDALSGIVKSSLDGGVEGLATSLKDVDPATRSAITRCGVKAAADGMMGY
ncbi:MAG: hypothetical protein MUF14_02025 [Hyphomonadaceae bacterium]|jgi:hypothetical protein|nr:hypothetical protein [Hyphomonadaceae bacterium]